MERAERVAVIGNGGGGKSTLARLLAARFEIPNHEVDAFQFGPGWRKIPEEEVRERIASIMKLDRWLIDGFGPYDTIAERFERADCIIFVDHPLWVHYWWAMERQIAAHQGKSREGGPDSCDLRVVNRQMCEAIWYVHTELRPKLIADLEPHLHKTEWIRSPEELSSFADQIAAKNEVVKSSG